MPIKSLISILPANLEAIVMVVFFVATGLFLGSMANRAVRLALNRTKLEGLAATFIARAARIGIYVIALVSALGTLGVDTTSLILAFNGAFRQGDTIEVNSVIGTVMEIDLLTTELKTPDTKKVVIPNGSLMQSSVVNYSAYPSRRIEFLIGISYDDDINKAETIIWEVIAQQSFCLTDPEAVVGADNLGDFGQNILVRVWVDSDFVITGKMQLLREIKRAFDREKTRSHSRATRLRISRASAASRLGYCTALQTPLKIALIRRSHTQTYARARDLAPDPPSSD
jgi:small conductance mechanosensitive channel